MTDETTTEQLVGIERQAESTPATEYTPPEGWRVLQVGERLQFGDMTVRKDGYCYSTERVGYFVGANQRYIRLIEPQPESQPKPVPVQVQVQVCEGRWRTRNGDIRNVKATPDDDDRATEYPWYDARYDQTWASNGRCYLDEENQRDLVEYLGPIEPQPQAEQQPQPEPVQVREGRWRTRNGLVKDVTAMPTNHEDFAAAYPWWDGVSTWRNDGRWLAGGSTMDLIEYLGPIEPQPETQPEPEPEPEKSITPDNVAGQALAGVWNQAKAERTIEELRSEVSYVQRLLGESRQRVTELEELVTSLRTINEAQEKAVEAAGKENTALQLQVQNRQQEYERQKGRIEFLETLNAGNGAAIGDYIAKVAKLQSLVDTARGQLETAATEHDSLSTQLAAVKAELVTQAETSRRLQIELDAAQQVPADSPELRQLRADLAEVTRERDQYLDSYQRIFGDLETIRETTKSETVEAIAEWLQAFRGCNNPALALLLVEALPSIMRSLTGLEDEEIE